MSFGYIHDAQEKVNQWLDSLGKGRSGLSLDAQGNCFLVSDNEVGLLVSCPEGSQQVVIVAQLINIPIPLSVRLYEELLALNINVEFTRGTQLFFDKKIRTIGLLVSRDVVSLDDVSFQNLLTNFKDKALEIREFIDALLYGSSSSLSNSKSVNLSSHGTSTYHPYREGA
jgi:hypothetical protein